MYRRALQTKFNDNSRISTDYGVTLTQLKTNLSLGSRLFFTKKKLLRILPPKTRIGTEFIWNTTVDSEIDNAFSQYHGC